MSDTKEFLIHRKTKDGRTREAHIEADSWEEAEELAAKIDGTVLGVVDEKVN